MVKCSEHNKKRDTNHTFETGKYLLDKDYK